MMRFVTTIAVLALAACSPPAEEQAPASAPQDSSSIAVDFGTRSGAETYGQFCARCHEEGVNGAPRTGDRDAWEGRSWLWEAVLVEHARSGYLAMPARGGDGGISDDEISRAAEYMLTLTYPEAPRD